MRKRTQAIRRAAVFPVIVAIAMLVGCAGGGSSTNTQQPNAQPATTQSAEGQNAGQQKPSEPIKIKMLVTKNDNDRSSWKEKEAIKMIERDLNMTLDITEVPSMAWHEKVGVTIASGDLPDVIIGRIPNLSLNKDSFYPLNDLIEQYAPTLAEFYDKYPEYKFAATAPDDNIYTLPLVQAKGTKVNAGFSINKSWLDKLNLAVPQTTDELYEVLKAFKQQDPNGNGQADEIPYTFYNEPNYGLDIMLWNFGLINDGETNTMVENDKVIFVPSDPRYLEYLQFLHKLYAEGLMDPDGFVQKNPDYIAKGKKNVVGMFNNHSYSDIVVGPDLVENFIDILPMKDKNGNITVAGERTDGDLMIDEVAISKDSKYAEAIVKMYEYMNSDFSRMMTLSFGPENVVWRNVENNQWEKITQLPEGINNFAEFRHTESPGMTGFYLLTPEDAARMKVTDPRDQKFFEKAKLYEPYLKKERIPLGMDTMEAQQQKSTMHTEINTYIQNFRAQSVLKGVSEAEWNAHLDKLKKLKVDEYVQLHQAFYDRAKSMLK